ncbi:hypothetical protein Pmar_PMAR020715 [Perkinsus marinus ATCC 50983]|uniref:J domain-containing protein n=1 Tax=Perkinsus marinus (strain ATCC 50983 / TXsc) TaxID=423536 RepID=C5KVX2_PERM5|nr:hypothetical protein Pmar_PMAR020715 [Perkinsus marinus ATCC 50983]EER11364.1 hypothetical protein Pmar_PMAR020715 [Perkinsus marinus ATCC 50983]|eukprot:XP_002779569.1 hypothetical protein Pmar_PMAR020715 [Perkinsus marinus ATCC 50983]
MGQTHTRHVYNLSSRDVQIYAVKPSEVDDKTWPQWVNSNIMQVTKSKTQRRSIKANKQNSIIGIPEDRTGTPPEASTDGRSEASTIKVDRYLIGSVGFKTSRTLKFPAKATRVTLVAAGGAGNISEIPKMPPSSKSSSMRSHHSLNRRTLGLESRRSSKQTAKQEWELASMTKDLVIEENHHGLRTLRLAYRDDKVHGERLLYVVNVDAVEKLVPAIEENKIRMNATSPDMASHDTRDNDSTTTTPRNQASDGSDDEWQWVSARPQTSTGDTDYSTMTPTLASSTPSNGKKVMLSVIETPEDPLHVPNHETSIVGTGHLVPPDPESMTLSKPDTDGEGTTLTSPRDKATSTHLKKHRTVKTSKSSLVSSNVFGAATSAVTGGVTKGVDSYRKQQLERQMALRAFLMSVPEPPMSEEASGLVIAYVGKLSIDWVKVAKEAGVGAARGTLMGGTVGAAVMGGMIGFSRAGAMFDAANNVGAATVMRGMGTGLGVMVSAAITACEVGYHVRKCKQGKLHVRTTRRKVTAASMRGAANAGLCALTIVPGAGLIVAIIGGVAFNICDATFGWSDKAANKLVPRSEDEEVFEGKVVHEKMIEAARETLGLSPEESLDEDDLKRRLRRWMLSLHPDKNAQQVHPHLHTIVTACTILINEARDIEAQRNLRKVENPLESTEDNDVNPYQLLCLMDEPDTHSERTSDGLCRD